MKILELIKENRDMKAHTVREITITLVSDCFLDPWFPLLLERAFGENNVNVEIIRRSFSERYEIGDADYSIVWLSHENMEELQSTGGTADLWIVDDNAYNMAEAMPYGGRIDASEMKKYGYNIEGTVLLLNVINSVRINDTNTDSINDLIEVYEQTTRECWNVYEIEKGRRKKCLVLDCDNVLWNGVLEEIGTGNVSSKGKEHLYQLIHELCEHGVIICLCSKNDYEDVREQFRTEEKLRQIENDIVYWGISWEQKSAILSEMIEKLHIDVRDIVFVDDSESEVLDVQLKYPDMKTIQYVPCIGEQSIKRYFPIKAEDKSYNSKMRIFSYLDDEKRKNLEQTSISKEEYLQKLNTKVTIRKAEKEDCGRISELSRRTNRCTNGKRLIQREVYEMLLNRRYSVYVINVTDRFRDLGIVGAAIVDEEKQKLLLLCLSCRVLGRDIEKCVLSKLKKGITEYVWFDTGKNSELKHIIEMEIGHSIFNVKETYE